MRKNIDMLVKYSLIFLLGAVVSAYLAVRFHSIRTIEKIQIASSAMETYKAVATLELLRREKKDAAMDFLEWQADEGLMGLSFYTSDPRRSKKLDAFALEAISKAREYREIYPRNTKNNNTDETVFSATSFGYSMTKSMKKSSSLLKSNFPPAETDKD